MDEKNEGKKDEKKMREIRQIVDEACGMRRERGVRMCGVQLREKGEDLVCC